MILIARTTALLAIAWILLTIYGMVATAAPAPPWRVQTLFEVPSGQGIRIDTFDANADGVHDVQATYFDASDGKDKSVTWSNGILSAPYQPVPIDDSTVRKMVYDTFSTYYGITHSRWENTTWGDVNGDNKLDIIFLSRTADLVEVVMSSATGPYTATDWWCKYRTCKTYCESYEERIKRPCPAGFAAGRAFSNAVGDFDDNGKDDFAYSIDNVVQVIGAGKLMASVPVPANTFYSSGSIAAGNVDGDHADELLALQANEMIWYDDCPSPWIAGGCYEDTPICRIKVLEP